MWIYLAFMSACMLGIYDVFKKTSLKDNAVIPVLFLNTIFCSLLFLPLIIASRIAPETMADTIFYVPKVSFTTHLYIVLKAAIVLASWLFAYFALKHLPITLASPMKAAQPMLTLTGAILVFGERLNIYQWVGITVALTAFFLLSRSGKKEGIQFTNNKWVWSMVLSVVTGSMSGLYDKYLMQYLQFDRLAVQALFNYYQVAIMALIMMFIWFPNRSKTTPFQWRWSIIFISVFLVCADFVYFYALSDQNALISVVSLIRRSGVIVSFIAGWIFFKEKNIKGKAFNLSLVLIAMLLLYYGSQL